MPPVEQIPPGQQDLLSLTATIVAAHTANNVVTADQLPGLIREVHQTLRGLNSNGSAINHTAGEIAPKTSQQPAVPAKRSVFPTYIICLEDGKKLKMLKRHLQTAYGMTPEQYRKKWGLASNYPMVAPEYAATRSNLAKASGLGKPRTEASPPRKAAAKKAARKAPATEAAE